jgi:hypothetical protein
MANTFKALCELADWSATAKPAEQPPEAVGSKLHEIPPLPPRPPESNSALRELELHYNIQLILPESRDQAVYDALFSSLRRHLM